MKKLLLFIAVAVLFIAIPVSADVCTMVNPAGCTGADNPEVVSPQVVSQDEPEDVCTVVNPAGCTGDLFLESYFGLSPKATTMDVCTVVNPAGCTGDMLFWQAYFGLLPDAETTEVSTADSNQDVCTVVNPAGCTGG